MSTKGVELAQKGDHPRTVPVEGHPLPHCGVTEVQLHVNLAMRTARCRQAVEQRTSEASRFDLKLFPSTTVDNAN